MLVLSRKAGESLRIGDDVRLTVLDLGGGQVRIGIEAAGGVAVHREEVWMRIANANHEAAGDAPDLPRPTLGSPVDASREAPDS